MERGPRDSLEDAISRPLTWRPKSAMARQRYPPPDPDPSVNVVTQQHAKAVSVSMRQRRSQTPQGMYGGNFNTFTTAAATGAVVPSRHHQRDQQGDSFAPLRDLGVMASPVGRPMSARGCRRQQHPSHHTPDAERNQSQVETHRPHDLTSSQPRLNQASEAASVNWSGEGASSRTQHPDENPYVSQDDLNRGKSSGSFDQDDPEVKGPRIRPKSSKGRQRYPVQPQPQSQEDQPWNTYNTQGQGQGHHRYPVPTQSQEHHAPDAKSIERPGSHVYPGHNQAATDVVDMVESNTNTMHSYSLSTHPLLVPRVSCSSLNKYCVLPSIRKRDAKSLPKHMDQ